MRTPQWLSRSALVVALVSGALVHSPALVRAASGAAESLGLREGLACPAVNSCWAANMTNPNSLLHWDGHHWSSVTMPLPAGPPGSQVGEGLHGITCVSVRDCWAVGGYGWQTGTALGYGYLTEHWNGSTWHYVPAALPAAAVGSLYAPDLESVTCISATNCWAVGSAGLEPTASHWDGHRWTVRTVQPGASPVTEANSALLYDVSCAGFDCWAVGTGHGYTFDRRDDTSSSYIVRHLVKGVWVTVTAPRQPVSAMEDSVHIACPARDSCWVVGTRYDAGTFDPHLGRSGQVNDVLHWNGKRWASVAVPSPGGHKVTHVQGLTVLPASALLDVSCSSVNDCWAVGAYTHVADPPLVRGQVLHWNGKRWSVLASPKPVGAVDAGLVGVDCPHGRGCAVIGYGVTDHAVDVLLAHRAAGRWAA